MNIHSELTARFAAALRTILDEPFDMGAMVRPTADPKFGDYQANFAMSLGKRLGKSPQDVASAVVSEADFGGLCEQPEIAGPGFINVRLRAGWLAEQLNLAVRDSREGVPIAANPRTVIVDYSSPNVAKPMHVGHIRSTAIGRAIANTLRFQGHHVVTDNHLGDWGTQFGMIIYGYRNFVNQDAYKLRPVEELSRVYRIVSPLVDYYDNVKNLPNVDAKAQQAEAAWQAFAGKKVDEATLPAAEKKQYQKERQRLNDERTSSREEAVTLQAKIQKAEEDPTLGPLIASGKHAAIGKCVLAETAKLHAGDAENLQLWQEFMPACLSEIQRVYDRLGVTFDETLGESFYHDQLSGTVDELINRKLATESNGAICVFVEGISAPMIVRKQDGAFLYATTDLATIRYRMNRWQPDAIIYVVDHRQSMHFEQLFEVAKLWGYDKLDLRHIGFGTVLGEDGRPYKTRSGDAVGLWGLLDEAAARAKQILTATDGPAKDFSPETQAEIAEAVGMGAIIYADLSQDRSSDYVFSYDKMLALTGNTAAYMQYAYARVRGIFSRGDVNADALRASNAKVVIQESAERALGLTLLRFSEALDAALHDYRPHYLTNYLYELAGRYSVFFEQCPVLKAPTPEIRDSRLLLCDLTARVLKRGLELLGIRVLERM